MKIAAAAYPLDWHNRWNEFVGKLRVWIRTAAENGAELLVFPEYGAMELASLAREDNAGDLQRSIDAVSARIKDVDELHGSLAREFRVHIAAGSAPLRRPSGAAINRTRIFAPDGAHAAQDKLIMTRFERDTWLISPGDSAHVFETALGRIGILTGYDAEFPLIARRMAEAGAEILLVPSCTSTAQGHARVRIGARARALENQCVVVQAVTVGTTDWLAAIEVSTGAAGIFAPPDAGFPEDGVVASGKADSAGWTYGEVSLDALRHVRENGTVLNLAHWSEQDDRLLAVAATPLGEPLETAP